MENLICALCAKKTSFKQIFYKEQMFASSDVFEFEALKEYEDEDYARGTCVMDLRQCLNCGALSNFAFNSEKVNQAYLSKSYYQQKNFTPRLNKTLLEIKEKIKLHASKNSVFLEIAPGLCDLLVSLAKDAKFIYSVDPSVNSNLASNLKNVKHIKDFFSTSLLKNKIKHKIDFIIFRHLLEHIEKPRVFLQEVVELLDLGSKIYIEVPNAAEIFKHKKFYELFHDHVNFFQKNVLINAMNELGCKCIDEHFLYEEQWLGLVFEKKSFENLNEEKLDFEIFDTKIFDEAILKLNDYLLPYKNIALYGGGDSLKYHA